jgi:hypothetical protein
MAVRPGPAGSVHVSGAVVTMGEARRTAPAVHEDPALERG